MYDPGIRKRILQKETMACIICLWDMQKHHRVTHDLEKELAFFIHLPHKKNNYVTKVKNKQGYLTRQMKGPRKAIDLLHSLG